MGEWQHFRQRLRIAAKLESGLQLVHICTEMSDAWQQAQGSHTCASYMTEVRLPYEGCWPQTAASSLAARCTMAEKFPQAQHLYSTHSTSSRSNPAKHH